MEGISTPPPQLPTPLHLATLGWQVETVATAPPTEEDAPALV
jgi:hypothetical protein